MPKPKTLDLVIRQFDGTEVGRVTVNQPTRGKVDRVVRGLLINMRDDCYVDESAADGLDDASD